ncbi:D-alanyl-D-alanine carboxypeptidase/D-alanyl-D-alanine endopeptidase [Neolewinella aquimaris]|uniref:D-alanyl-D-alanine carboxypeptidase/D-alanyl-D-alanine endopeptidase n=1 Tax=Neolewinella aquimaris TaxID=1835722 RepID=UPI001615C86E|nr:D-alanyl-D-alanine carboxypeptidase/D-alanyl-D-alanine-endopeptidase [Neolewinella aquimaris]
MLLLLLAAPLSGQGTIQHVVRAFAGAQELKNAAVAVDVRDVATGRQLAGHNASVASIPASTQKLITTAVAMDILGEDHRFRTRLVAGGVIEGGVLRGNLYLVGGGDPTLGSPFVDEVAGLEEVIQRWVQKVKASGITRITGAVVGDGSYYTTDGAGRGWTWADLGNYYGAGTYGLNLNENSYYLSFSQRQREGATPPVIGTEPQIPGLEFINELVSGPRGSGDQAYIFGAPFNYRQYVRGSIPVGTGRFRIRGSIPDPPLFAAQLLDRELKESGIEVIQPPTTHQTVGTGDYRSGRVLDELMSPPLSTIVDRTNLTSNNLFAETLLREMNKARGNTDLASTDVITDWLEARGIATEGIQLQDGSGLSPRNFFPPETMTALLADRSGDERWRESIPLAGRTGSLRRVLTGTVAEGRVWGKSGTINAVRAYAGYVDRPDGRRLAYSVAVNNHTMRGSQLNRLIYDLMRDLCTASL